MTSRRHKGLRSKEARHVRLYHSMLKTPAWKSLDAVARALYIDISRRYGGPGSNNGRIPYSVREGAKELRVGKTKAALALQALQDRGFIIAMTLGGFNRKDRHATEWLVTEYPSDLTQVYEAPRRTYESWKPDTKIQNAVSTDGLTVSASGLSGTHRRNVAA
jgi:hypothetical protein